MGQFSWLDCKTREQIVDGRMRNSYVLVPEEFGGGHIEEPCYEGYGMFGGHDVYDLVADWNRAYISPNMLEEPRRELWGDVEWAQKAYEGAVRSWIREKEKFSDFIAGVADEEMEKRYGGDWKRIIGIHIACGDRDNAALRYPIKITHDPMAVYEQCGMSSVDPDQGWIIEAEDEEEWW